MTTTRRRILQSLSATAVILPSLYRKWNRSVAEEQILTKSNTSDMNTAWIMPDEGEQHECTWMAFGPTEQIWGRRLMEEVRKNLAIVAETIAEFEPVVVCVREQEQRQAKEYFSDLSNIAFVTCELNDLWIRDYGAVFVRANGGNHAAVDFNFNGWGQKQDYEDDAEVAAMMAAKCGAELIPTDLCLEGGGIEVDGMGTAIITESCVLNRNRNPGWSRKECESELQRVLGLQKVIWLPGVKGADITDGHTDFYARFAGPGVVLAHLDMDPRSPEYALTRKHFDILQTTTDAQGNQLKVFTLEAPSVVRERFRTKDFCAGYINFYICNHAVIAPQFGDRKTDRAAKDLLGDLFPDRKVVLLNVDGIAAGGGGIHCATLQQPASVGR